MNEKDVNEAISGIIDFVAMLWTSLVIPLIQGIGALFEMLPPVALGIIAGVIGLVWLFRKARHG